jgi:hypothetical protein
MTGAAEGPSLTPASITALRKTRGSLRFLSVFCLAVVVVAAYVRTSFAGMVLGLVLMVPPAFLMSRSARAISRVLTGEAPELASVLRHQRHLWIFLLILECIVTAAVLLAIAIMR